MDLDAEILEFNQILNGNWFYHPDWKVDAITEDGKTIDVKFIRKYWNVSREKTINLIKQRKILDYYEFWEWSLRPNRPLIPGDVVEVKRVGSLPYDTVADNLKKSYKEPDGFYVDVRMLIAERRDNEN